MRISGIRSSGLYEAVRGLVVAVLLLVGPSPLAQSLPATIEINAVGDVLLARGIQRQVEKYGEKYPFEKVTEALSGADLVFGNLENPLTDNCKKAEKKYSLQARPRYAEILRAASFDVLSLANNHSLDCGSRGLLETIDNLEKEDLRWLGAGRSKDDENTPVYLEINEIKLAFLGFTDVSPEKLAEGSPRVAFANHENITSSIKVALQRADVIIVSFHWGTEYAARPNAEQIRFADAAVAAGADVVLGHHPHVLQGFQLVTRSNGGSPAIVAYSLGNFLFDSPVKLNRRVGESVLLKLQVGKHGLVAAEAVPIIIENYRPVFADGINRNQILARLNRLSGDFNTRLENGYLTSKKGNTVENAK